MTKTLLTTVAAFALLPTAGFAASDDIVVTATRSEQDASQVGQAITTISFATLESRQSVSVSDILVTTPGVTAVRTGGVGSVTSLFIRGANSDHTLVVIDGVRVNDPSNPTGTYDFGNLLAGNIARVEILRGADSVPWGSAAIGGVVNITTFAPTKQLSGALTAEGGSYDTKSLSGHLAGTLGPVALSVGGGWYNTGGISAFAKSDGGKEADGYDQHNLNARAEVHVSDSVSLDFRGRYARSLVQQDGYNNPTFGFGDDPEYTITRELSGTAGVHLKLLDGRFNNTLAYTVSDTRRRIYDPSGFNGPAGIEFGYKGQVQRIEYQGDFKLNSVARLAFGAEHEASLLLQAPDIFGGTGGLYRTAVDGFYGQVILTPLDTFTLTGGLRYDNHRVYGGHTTFGANGAWRPTRTTTIRASYAEGFKAPTLAEIFGDGGVFTVTNPALKPETATSYDVGFEQSALSGAVRASLTYYNRNTRDLIQYRSVADSLCTNGFPFSCGINQNLARAKAEGVEASIVVRPVTAFTASFNYTHGRSYDAATGLRLLRRPDDSIVLNLDWDAGRVKLGGMLQMVSGSFDTDNITFAPRVPLQGYVLVGLRAAVPITHHLELYGRIDNLLDEQYQVVKHYGTLGRAAYAGVRVKI